MDNVIHKKGKNLLVYGQFFWLKFYLQITFILENTRSRNEESLKHQKWKIFTLLSTFVAFWPKIWFTKLSITVMCNPGKSVDKRERRNSRRGKWDIYTFRGCVRCKGQPSFPLYFLDGVISQWLISHITQGSIPPFLRFCLLFHDMSL